jgi:ABC-type lipoprotein export system ATPase subunit
VEPLIPRTDHIEAGTVPPPLVLDRVHVAFGSRTVLCGVDLEVPPRTSVAVTGQSGSGKSSLIGVAVGLIRPSSGSVLIAGEPLQGLSRSAVAAVRRTLLGVVFQDGELIPSLTAAENVALVAVLDGVPGELAMARARAMLERLDVRVPDSPAGQLSGGERQRTAVARALVNGPTLVLADEPTGALDAANATEVRELLLALPSETGCAVVVVTHDATLAAATDMAWALVDGRLVA